MKPAYLLVSLALFSGGCASSVSSTDPLGEMFSGVSLEKSERIAATLTDKPLGSAGNPVRANMPSGERDYLERLRCANGQAPRFERRGSMGIGPYGMILDAYDVVCVGSSPATSLIHIDMYHPAHVETQATPGFSIIAP